MHDSLEQVHEALGSGVHDAGLLQQLHLLGRVLERRASGLERLGQEDPEVADLPRPIRHVPRPVADHGQDRPLDGPRDRRIRRFGGLHDRGAEAAGRNARRIGEPLRKPAEELGQDRAGVAAGPPDRLVRERAGHLANMALPEAGDPGRNLLERGGDVGSGVAVRNRKDVDLVEGLGALGDEVRARDDRAREAAAVQVPDRDQGLIGAGNPSCDRPERPAVRYSSATAGRRSR